MTFTVSEISIRSMELLEIGLLKKAKTFFFFKYKSEYLLVYIKKDKFRWKASWVGETSLVSV